MRNVNAAGRHRILMTAENVNTLDASSALNVLNDDEQYAFQNLSTMQLCAERAGVRLCSFAEACGRPPHHGYENEEFLQNQVDGTTSRFYFDPNDVETQFITDHNPELASWNSSSTSLEKEEKSTDAISEAVSGQHYNDVVPGYQYMEMMQYMLADKDGVESHLLGQVYKYLMRAGKKDDVEQEYRKARWYLNALVKFKQTGEIDCTGND